MISELPNKLNILSAGNFYFELFTGYHFRIFKGENFIFSWRCTGCKNIIRLAYYSGLKRAGKEVGSTQTLWMEDEQRHFVCNWMASAWLNVTHDECHGFFCPFQIAVRQGEGLGSYAQPWWNACLIPDLFCPLQSPSKFISSSLIWYSCVPFYFIFFLNHESPCITLLIISTGQTIKKSWGKLLWTADIREEVYCTVEIPKKIVEFEDGDVSGAWIDVEDWAGVLPFICMTANLSACLAICLKRKWL